MASLIICVYFTYRIVQKFDEFDEWLVIRQIFPLNSFYLNVSSMKSMINSSKFYFVNDLLVKVFPIKLLCYTVY